jgi:hypothetical protein
MPHDGTTGSEPPEDRALGPDGEIDPSFTGVDPDMKWLIGQDFLTSWEKLTAVQRQAAGLLAELLQPERVDDVLRLARGTVRGWSDDKAFKAETKISRRRLQDRVDDPVHEAALKPIQHHAAHLDALGMKKVEIAEALGCHRSTLHNWGCDPVYRRLVERISHEIQAERDREYRRQHDAELGLAHEVIVKVLRSSKSIEAAKLALSLVRLYEIDMKRA